MMKRRVILRRKKHTAALADTGTVMGVRPVVVMVARSH
jgi:hypothetical protein